MDEVENLNVEYVKDRKVCATGRLVSMTHAGLAELITACGGTYLRTPTRSSLILVVGDGGWPAERDGSPSHVFDRARRLKAYGYAIQFASEDEFLERLGLKQPAGAIRGLHTLSDLSRILDVSTVRLRRWLRQGLIQPVETKCLIPFFDFRQVAFINQVHALVEGGAALRDIRRGIEQARDLLPHGESLLVQWSHFERDGRVLVRLRDRLLDQTGQTYFEFEAEGESATLFAEAVRSGFHDLCDNALALEEEERYEEAADVYRRALQLQPDHPTLHFDLGNVLFRLGRCEESAASFRAALEHDPDFAMAWHNLGSVHAQQGDWDEAEIALRRALRLVPTYADSHFTLADVLRNQGKSAAAARHEAAYRNYSAADRLLVARDCLLRIVHSDDESKLPT